MTIAAGLNIAERLSISEREWEILSEILAKHLAGTTVWAFGSRATGKRVKRFSDLDLAIEERLTGRRGLLMDAFDESLLSFKVDVVEREMVDADFWERIEKDFVVVQGGG